MPSRTQVVVRQTSNSDVREYLVSDPISEQLYAKFYQPLWGSDEQFSDLGQMGEKIAQMLMEQAQADTIEKITFRPFSLTVHKSPSASWSRLEPLSIIPALERALDVDGLQIRHFDKVESKALRAATREKVRA